MLKGEVGSGTIRDRHVWKLCSKCLSNSLFYLSFVVCFNYYGVNVV